MLVELLLRAAVSPAEEKALTSYAKELSGTGTRAIARQIKSARQARAKEEAQEARKSRHNVAAAPEQWIYHRSAGLHH